MLSSLIWANVNFSAAIVRAQNASGSIPPARTTIPNDSIAGAPLFGYETLQLTDSVVSSVREADATRAFASLIAFGNCTARSQECKLMPGDAEWPNDTAWDTYDALLGNALIPTVPIASPCHTNWGDYDAAKCAEILADWPTEDIHISHPTSVFFWLFQGRTCAPTNVPDAQCTLGGYPAYAVNVSTVAQIQLAVNFARNSNLRLVIKNTGHDYLGKSLGAGALSIWTHNLKDIRFIPNFSNSGYQGPAMKLGAGVQVSEVYAAAHEHGVTALGGVCETVGYSGGYITGGGHNPLGSLYGMSADQVLGFEVVTADGVFRTVTADSNSDLFWALRGGGGSTFAVVTSVIIRTYPKIPVTISTFNFTASAHVSNEAVRAGIHAYYDNIIRFTDAGTYCYFWVYNVSNVLSFQMTPFWAPNHTVESFNTLLQPWFDTLRTLGISLTPMTTYYEDFYSAFRASFGATASGGASLVRTGNHIFPRANWEDPATLNATFEGVMSVLKSSDRFAGYHQAPRNYLNVSNAVNPAWRTAVSYLIGGAYVADGASVAEVETASALLRDDILGAWRKVAPNENGGGSYLNEADIEEPDWQEAFYGENYERLLQIKEKWDPEGVFYATTAVGSEKWVVRDGGNKGVPTQDGRLCRV